MLKLLVATAIALSAPLAVGSVAQAANTTVIIKKDNNHSRRHDRMVEQRRHGHDRGCVSKKVVRMVHGERVVKMTKVCR